MRCENYETKGYLQMIYVSMFRAMQPMNIFYLKALRLINLFVEQPMQVHLFTAHALTKSN